MLLTPAQTKPNLSESRQNSFFFFFTRGGCISCLRGCLGARLLPQSYYNPNLSESADCIGGQLRGDEECPFSGITKPGRVWRKVPESNARSIVVTCTIGLRILMSQGIFTPCFTSVSSVGQHQIIHGIDSTWHRQIDWQRLCYLLNNKALVAIVGTI